MWIILIELLPNVDLSFGFTVSEITSISITQDYPEWKWTLPLKGCFRCFVIISTRSERQSKEGKFHFYRGGGIHRRPYLWRGTNDEVFGFSGKTSIHMITVLTITSFDSRFDPNPHDRTASHPLNFPSALGRHETLCEHDHQSSIAVYQSSSNHPTVLPWWMTTLPRRPPMIVVSALRGVPVAVFCLTYPPRSATPPSSTCLGWWDSMD